MNKAKAKSEAAAWLAAVGGEVWGARNAAGLTYRDAATLAGVSVSTIQRAEAGGCDLQTLYRLAVAFGREPRDFLPPAD